MWWWRLERVRYNLRQSLSTACMSMRSHTSNTAFWGAFTSSGCGGGGGGCGGGG